MPHYIHYKWSHIGYAGFNSENDHNPHFDAFNHYSITDKLRYFPLFYSYFCHNFKKLFTLFLPNSLSESK